MRRIVLLLTAGALVMAMVAASAGTALAADDAEGLRNDGPCFN